MAKIVYGTYEYDTDAMHPATLLAFVSSGITHKHGSEVASAVIARIRKELAPKDADGKPVPKSDPATKEEVKAWKEANPDTLAEWIKEEGDAIYADAQAGELGVRAAGTPRDPLGAKIDSLAKEFVDEKIAARGITLPKGWKKKDDGPAITFEDGSSFTYVQLVDRAKARNAEAFDKKARKFLDDKSKALAKAKEAVAGAKSAEDLGL